MIMKTFVLFLIAIVVFAQTPDSSTVGSTTATLYSTYTLEYDVTAWKNYSSSATVIYHGQKGLTTTDYYVTKITGGTADSTTSSAITGLTEDTTYTWHITVVISNGVVSVGVDSSITTSVIAPTEGTSSGSVLKIIVSWLDNSSSETGYAIERDTVGGSSWVAIDTTAANVTVYEDSGSVSANGEYKYQVRGIGSNSNSTYLSCGSAVVTSPYYYLTYIPSTPSYTIDSTDAFVPDYFSLTSGSSSDFLYTLIESSNTITADNGWYKITCDPDASFKEEAYGVLEMATTRDTVTAGFRFFLPSTARLWDVGDYSYFFSIRDSTNDVNLLTLGIYDSGTDTIPDKWIYDITGASDGNTATGFALDDTLDMRFEVCTGNGTGFLKAWVEGDLIIDESSLTNDYNIEHIVIGQNGWGASADLCKVPTYFLFDEIYVHSSTPDVEWYDEVADTTVIVQFANNSGVSIDVSSMLMADSTVFTVVDTLSSFPYTLADDDTLDIEFVVDRGQSDGVYKDTLTIAEEYQTSELYFTVNIIGDTVGGSPPPSASSSIWYVASGGLGSETGTDSSNAWDVTGIIADSIEAGDTLYFIEGTYTSKLTVNFSGDETDLVYLMPNPTNSGDVLWSGVTISIGIANAEYLSLERFKITDTAVGIRIEETANVIYIDSMTIDKFGDGSGVSYGIEISGWGTGTPEDVDSIWIRYNTVTADSQCNAQTDVIFIQYATNVFILNNTISQENITADGHNDGIQIANHLGNIYIANNKIYNAKTTGSQGMMLNAVDSTDQKYNLYIYNNVIYGEPRLLTVSRNAYYSTDHNQRVTYVYNNTFFCTNTSPGIVSNVSIWDTTHIFKNNINIYETATISVMAVGTTDVGRFDYNYYEANTNKPIWYSSSAHTLGQWQGLGGDVNSIYNNPYANNVLFVDTSNNNFDIQSGSPADNAGEDLESEVVGWGVTGIEWEDIDGNARDSSPSIGAYEQ